LVFEELSETRQFNAEAGSEQVGPADVVFRQEVTHGFSLAPNEQVEIDDGGSMPLADTGL
jgi:hypothetical protein